MLFFKSYQNLLITDFIFLDKIVTTLKIVKNKKNKFNLFSKKLILSQSSLCDKKGIDHFRYLDSLIFLKKISGTRSCIKKYVELNKKDDNNNETVDTILNADNRFKYLIITQSILKKENLNLFLNYLKYIILQRSSKEDSSKNLIIYTKITKNLNIINKNINFNLYIKNPQYFCGCSKHFSFVTRKLCINLKIKSSFKFFNISNFWKNFLMF